MGKLAGALKPATQAGCRAANAVTEALVADDIDDEDREVLAHILDNESYSLRSISAALHAVGVLCHPDTIKKHRDGLCVCGKSN